MTRRLPLLVLPLLLCFSRCAGSADEFMQVDVFPPVGMDDLPILDPPFTAEETSSMRAGFDWNATTELPETDEDGHPSLFYMVLLVDSRATLELFELSGLYFDPMPLFPEELDRWDGQQGVLRFDGDGSGVFVFAMVPGAVYNRLRELALDDEPAVLAAIPRSVPNAAAVLPGGSLSYAFLAENGFTGVSPNDAFDASTATIPAADEGAGDERKRRNLRRLMNGIRAAVNGIRRVIADIRGGIGGERTVEFTVRVYNTDPGFFAPGTTPFDEDADGDLDERVTFMANDANLLVRVWGDNNDRGHMIVPTGARIMYSDNLSAVTGSMNEDGYVALRTPDGPRSKNDVKIFLRLANRAARMVHVGCLEDRIKLFDGSPGTGDQELERFEINSFSVKLQILAQMTDAWEYSARILEHRPPPANVIDTERDADAVSSTLCLNLLSFPGFSSGDTFGAAELDVTRTDWTRYFASIPQFPFVDHVDIRIEGSRRNRYLATHEYGHFIWCSMLSRAPGRLQQAGPQGLRWEGPSDLEDEGNTLSEAFADFVASQVAGAVDYTVFDALTADRFGGASYCNAEDQVANQRPCIEDNVGGPIGGQFPAAQLVSDMTLATDSDRGGATARPLTIMSDFFDGHPLEVPGSPNASTPGNGTGWTAPRGGTLVPAEGDPRVRGDLHANDEAVALLGSGLQRSIERWWDHSRWWRFKPYMNGLTRVALADGAAADDVCVLLAQHSRDLTCNEFDGFRGLLHLLPPENFTVSLQGPPGGVTWNAGWFDPSPFAPNGYIVQATPANAATPIFAFASVPWRRDYLTTPYAGADRLPYDAHLEFSVAGVAPEQEGGIGPATRVLVWSPAEPVSSVTGTPTPGGINVGWTAVQATQYEVRLRVVSTGAVRVLGRTTETSFPIIGLLDSQTYDVIVVPVNGEGSTNEEGWGIASGIRPLAPVVAYVSAIFGDDTHPQRGSSAHPYASLGAALNEASVRGFTLVRLHQGVYNEGSGIFVSGVSLAIEGGYATTAGIWTRTGGSTTVNAPMNRLDGFAYRTSRFLNANRVLLSAFHVAGGANVSLNGLTIAGVSGADTPSDCGAAIAVTNATVSLENARAQTTYAVPGSCRIGLHARGASTVSASVGTRVAGYESSGSTPAALSVAGGAIVGPVALSLQGSVFVGLSDQAATYGTVQVMLGLGMDGGDAVSLSRATVLASDGPPVAMYEGTLLGLDVVASQSVRVDNSFLRTPATANGSSANAAIALRAESRPGQVLSSVRVYFSSIAVGEHWQRSSHFNSFADAVSIFGRASSVVLKNNIFVIGDRNARALVRTLGMTNTSSSTIDMRGNAFSIGGQNVNTTICFPEYLVNAFDNVGCTTSEFPLALGHTVETVPDALAGFQAFVFASNWIQSNVVGQGAEAEARAPWLDRHGRLMSASFNGAITVVPTGTFTRFDDGGVVLSGSDPVDVMIDLAGSVRPSSGTPDVGAYVLP